MNMIFSEKSNLNKVSKLIIIVFVHIFLKSVNSKKKVKN